MLELAAWGVKEPLSLVLARSSAACRVGFGKRLLVDLGALDGTGSLTSVGREMVRFPLHPRLSRLLLRAKDLGHAVLGADLAAILSEREMFRPSAQRSGRDPDMSERLDALRDGEKAMSGRVLQIPRPSGSLNGPRSSFGG